MFLVIFVKVRYFLLPLPQLSTKIGPAQAGLELLNSNDPPYWVSWTLGLQVCTTVFHLEFFGPESYSMYHWKVLDKKTRVPGFQSRHLFCFVGRWGKICVCCMFKEIKHELTQTSSIIWFLSRFLMFEDHTLKDYVSRASSAPFPFLFLFSYSPVVHTSMYLFMGS